MKSKTTIVGHSGSVDVDGAKLSPKAQWSMATERDYVDASVFGEVNKNYLVGIRTPVSGSFEGVFDPESIDRMYHQPGATQIALMVSYRPAWWIRLGRWVRRLPSPEYAMVEGTVDMKIVDTAPELIAGEFKFTDGATMRTQPMTNLERRWNRFCTRVKHPHWLWRIRHGR